MTTPQVQFLREDEVSAAPPSLALLAQEGRAVLEYAAYLRQRRALRRELPRGDGHAVVVIPGFAATDASTRPLRGLLRDLGYAAHGWGLLRNLGMRAHVREALNATLERLHRDSGRKVSLIGWSLGGVFVRELARQRPELVRRVITLGSPFNGHPDANNVMGLYKLVNRGRPVKLDWEGFQRRRTPPPVPCTAIYSKSDGIIAWRCSLEEPAPNTENVEVRGSHYGLGFNPQVMRVIAQRLARPET